MIILDGKNISEFGFEVEPGHEDPITPNMERKTIAIPGRAGLWDFGTEIREKPFSFPIKIMDRFHDNMQQAYNELVAFLFDQYGQPREIKMVREYEPDKFYMVKVVQQMIPERLTDEGTLVLPLVADEGYKFALANEYDPKENYVYDQDYQYDIGLMYDNPTSFQWIYDRHYSGINNYSSLNTDFMIEINGTVSNPSVTNLVTNQKLTLPSISNGKLVIDGKRFVVIKSGQDILEGSNYNFFHIQPGEVGFLFEGENPNATVTYRWLHKFM